MIGLRVARPPAAAPDRVDLTRDISDLGHTGSVAVAAPASLPPCAGRYEILDEIARGGMGIVYRAHDPSVNRSVAVKILQERFRNHPVATSRFFEEGQITGQLQHPGIPAVHEIGTLPDGSPFIAMKLIKGVTLAEQIVGPNPDRSQLVTVLLQVAQAVGYAHSKGVIHRDLKPANIMLGQFGEVQVMDWGLAKVLSPTAPGSPAPRTAPPFPHSVIESWRSSDPGAETQAGSVLGTPSFMAPEQAAGQVEMVDERADVFGLGAILCTILTGEPPFRDTTLEGVRLRAVRGQVEDAFARLDACGADPELVTLCKQCLAPDRESRPRNAGEVAAAVSAHQAAVEDRLRGAERERAAAEARTAEAVNTQRVAEEKAAEQRKRRRAQHALLLCLAALLFGAGAVAWWADRQAGERRADVLHRQLEDQERAQERAREDARRTAAEQQRLGRNAQAIESLIGQCEDALRNDDADRAAAALQLAEQRVAEGGGEDLRPRLGRCKIDLAMLRDLDHADDLRWTAEDGRFLLKEAYAQTATAFRRFGIVPGKTRVEEAALRVNESLIRDRVLTALDHWLVRLGPPALGEILHAADPYRDEFRAAGQAKRQGRQQELADRPEVLGQPARFTAALGAVGWISPARRELILLDALRSHPGNFRVLMALAYLVSGNDRASAEKRAGFFRAALAVRPTNVAGWNNLGATMSQLGNLDAAAAAYREAIRVRQNRAPIPLKNLANVLKRQGDLEGAAAAYRELVKLTPTDRNAHYNLGITLRDKGDLDGAVGVLQELTRLHPKDVPAQRDLGHLLQRTGDLDGAVAAFKEVARIEPDKPGHQATLRRAEEQARRWRKLLPRLPDIAAGRAQPKDSTDALALADLCREPFQRRYVLSVSLANAAFAAEPTLADNLAEGHRFQAATAAVRAATGQDADMRSFGVEEWTYLTGLALQWLRADLALLTAQAKDPKQATRKSSGRASRTRSPIEATTSSPLAKR